MAKPPARQQKPSRNTRNPARNLPAIISPNTGASSQTMASNSSADEPKKKRNWITDPAMFLVGVATVIVVGVYTWYARQQVIETQNANAIAAKALTEANRPYVMWAALFPTRVLGQNAWRAGVTFTNFGNTPASSVKPFMCDPIIRKDSIVPAFSCNISEASQPGPDIGPKQSINLIGPIIQDSEMDATEKEEKFIYVLGGISYTDNTTITENAEPRITKFCQRIQKTNKAPEPTRPPGAIAPPAGESPTAMQTQIFAVYTCPGYNCVDMGCK